MFADPDQMNAWINGRYVERMRQQHGDSEARRMLSEEEQEMYVADALAEIDAMRDPPPEPPDDEFDDENEIDRGGEG